MALKPANLSTGGLRPASLAKHPDILAGVAYGGTYEEDAAAELDAVAQGFRDRKAAEDARRARAEDGNFWAAVVFQSEAQRDAFVRALGVRPEDPQYLDGQAICRALGIELPPAPRAGGAPRIDKDFSDLAL